MNTRLIAILTVFALVLASRLLSAEDLLAEDHADFSPPAAESLSLGWPDGFIVGLNHQITQGRDLTQSRSELEIEYERALGQAGYGRLHHRFRYFWPSDGEAKRAGQSFGVNQLHEAWYQHTFELCNAKLGRQSLFWGTVEGAYAVDIISPFDFTEPLITDFASIRLGQDMLVARCFYLPLQFEFFWAPQARLDQLSFSDTEAFDRSERRLHDEFGLKLQHSWEGGDLALMVARLYGNTPVPIVDQSNPAELHLIVERFNFVGLSLAQAIGRFLLEFDLGYKQDQVTAYSGKKEDLIEAALGFEYRTSGNHQFSAGVWQSRAQAQLVGEARQKTRVWTLAWSKAYLHEILLMSILGVADEHSDFSSMTLQTDYQWNDYLATSFALAYRNAANLGLASTHSEGSGWQLAAGLEFTF